MHTSFSGYTRQDRIFACCVVLLLFLLAGMQLTYGMSNWGDDFAAYISEGIAISTGSLKDQAVRNYTLHLAQLPDSVSEEGLVYVWGFPLLLALIHRIVGFDMIHYGSLIFYKLPSLIALSLTAGVMYLYYRRRFSQKLSGFLTIILCFQKSLIHSVDHLNVDVLFLFLFWLTLFIADCFFDALPGSSCQTKTWLLGVALGALMWYTCVTRLNGITIIIIVAAYHILHLIANHPHPSFRQTALHVLPYAIFAALWFGVHLLLPPATSNLSDVGKATPGIVWDNILYYGELMKDYCNGLIGGIYLPVYPLMLVFLCVGIWKAGLSPQNLPFTIFFVGSFVVLFLLPYTQGLRYLFNILPIFLLFTAYGGIFIWEWLKKKYPLNKWETIISGISLVLVLMILSVQLNSGISNLAKNRAPDANDVYTQDSIEAYRYIQDNIPEDQIVAFCKSRALYLNTGRMSFRLGYNGHILEDADYYLFSVFMHEPDDWETVTNRRDDIRLIWSNDTFLLYEIVK